MTKEQLRDIMRRKRRALTQEEIFSYSRKIREQLFMIDCIKSANTVCTFLSAFKEPDTTEIIRLLLKSDKRVAVPVTDEKSITLSLSYIDSMENLTRGAYGIYEPSAICPADIRDVDAVLVPALAFDRKGGRMGFGKGYYDKLLTEKDCVKIGLCYDFQLFDKIPTEPHDVMMDIIITEKEILEVGN